MNQSDGQPANESAKQEPKRERNRMRGRQLFALGEPGLALLSQLLRHIPLSIRRVLLRYIRRWQGLPGVAARYALLSSMGVAPKPNVSVLDGVYLLHVEGLRFGRNVSVHPMCYIDAWAGIVIGDDVSIAHAVTIMSTNHRFDRFDLPIKEQGVTAGPVEIGNDCWIGAQAVILAGVRIGPGSIVAANSVVTKDVPERTVVAGSPASVIRTRGPEDVV